MKNKAKKLIRNILIGAVASLYSTSAQAKESTNVSFLDNLNDDDKKDAVNALKNKIYKNVLQITKKGDTKLIAGHRSHMSHRSGGGGGGGGHYSHASHFSSYGGGGGHNSHSSHSSSSYTPAVSRPAPKTYKTYSLGDRTLRNGLYGKDVSELTTLLISKQYLSSSWITMQNGYPVYNNYVTSAIRRFQKDAGITVDGIANSTTISRLRDWDRNKSTILLGIRDISYSENQNVAGNDVDELIALLRKAGYSPNPAKLEYKNGKAIFTKDIETAVKLFQAYNGLNPDGIVNDDTINKLKAIAK